MNPTTAKLGLCLGMMLPAVGVGAREQWETLFEGTVVAEETDGMYMHVEAIKGIRLMEGKTVRLTVDDESQIYTVTSLITTCNAGNGFLDGSSDSDDGFDMSVVSFNFELLNHTIFYFRAAGTYSIKLERMVS